MNIGSIEIDLKANDRGLTRAFGQIERFAKHTFQVVSKNNKQFKELHDVLGDVGIGIGVAADAMLQWTGKGNLGLVQMIKNTRVLGKEMGTWLTVGALEGRKGFESLSAGIKSRWLDLQEWFAEHPFLGNALTFGGASALGLTHKSKNTDEAKRSLEQQRIDIAKAFQEQSKAWDDMAKDANKEDAERSPVAILADDAERAKKAIDELSGKLNSFGQTSSRRFARSALGAAAPAAAQGGDDYRQYQSSAADYFAGGDSAGTKAAKAELAKRGAFSGGTGTANILLGDSGRGKLGTAADAERELMFQRALNEGQANGPRSSKLGGKAVGRTFAEWENQMNAMAAGRTGPSVSANVKGERRTNIATNDAQVEANALLREIRDAMKKGNSAGIEMSW